MAKMVCEQGAQVAMKKRRHVYEACLPTLLRLILNVQKDPFYTLSHKTGQQHLPACMVFLLFCYRGICLRLQSSEKHAPSLTKLV